jgi:hypothetical protein
MSGTPETDHLENELGSAAKFSHPVIWRHARQLERARDEAREALERIYQASMVARSLEEDFAEWEKAIEMLLDLLKKEAQ